MLQLRVFLPSPVDLVNCSGPRKFGERAPVQTEKHMRGTLQPCHHHFSPHVRFGTVYTQHLPGKAAPSTPPHAPMPGDPAHKVAGLRLTQEIPRHAR